MVPHLPLSRHLRLGLAWTLGALALMGSPRSALAQDEWRTPDPALLERAREILRSVPLVEGHNDLPSRLLDIEARGEAPPDLRRVQPSLPADIPRIREGMVGAQFWSAYTHADSIDSGGSLRHALRGIDQIHRFVTEYPDVFELARTADDIEGIFARGRIGSLIGVEGGHAIQNSLAALRQFHELGVRYMTLSHNRTIDWVDSATDAPVHGGLSSFGESVVREMNRLGMFVDISHVSAEAMRDVLAVTRAPVIFSHSSALAINSHPRNVPDDVLARMPQNGGVVMVNFYAGFVPPSGPEWRARQDSVRAHYGRVLPLAEANAEVARWTAENPRPRGTLSGVADHIEHIRAVAGIDHVGIGADYYDAGGPSMAEGLGDLTRFPYLFAELLRRGWSDDDLRKLAGENLLRAMRAMERVASELQTSVVPGRIRFPGAVGAAAGAAAQGPYLLVAGRRLPYLYAVSLDAALDPANDHTAHAVVSRSKVALDRLDGRPLGDPANLVVSEDGRTAYVVNHHGAIDNAEFRQHGGRGQVAVMDVGRALDRANDRTATALVRHMDTGGFGTLGVALLPELLVLSNAENHLTEDGGNRITLVDRRTGSLRGTVELALGDRDSGCPDYPVPHTSPAGPPPDLAVLSPDPGWGCYPDPNGLALGRTSEGRVFAFTANGGTDDVSVVDLARAVQGDPTAEVARIPVQVGPWGITATPDGRYVIVANGGSQRDGQAGNTLSFIDVDLAAAGEPGAEVARVLVGTDDPAVQTHPLIPTVTPDGREIVVPNVRADNVSIVDLDRALAGDPDAEVERIPLTRVDGRSARPKGSAISADGRYAVITGGPSVQPLSEESGYVYVIDLRTRALVATVTGVGNDPYGVAFVYR